MKIIGAVPEPILGDGEIVFTIAGICALVAISCGIAISIWVISSSLVGSKRNYASRRNRRNPTTNYTFLKAFSWISTVIGFAFAGAVFQLALAGFVDSDKDWFSVWPLFLIALVPLVAGQFGLCHARGLESPDKTQSR